MATSDLHSGAAVRLGVDNANRSAAKRVNIVTTADEAQALIAAAESAESTEDADYPYGTIGSDLLLKTIDVAPFGSTKALVTLTYGRDATDPPLGDPFDNADVVVVGDVKDRDYTVATRSYLGVNQDYISVSPKIRKPIAEIRVPFSLTTNPEGTVSSLIGKINSDAVSINGITRAINSLMFKTCQYQVLERSDGTKRYVGFYVFHWKADTWTRERFTITYQSSGERDIELNTTATEPTGTFVNAFPIPGGTGPSAPS